jgi:glycosyltransferase involved in cell wall biosynthesis
LKLNENEACTYISSSVDTNRFVPVNKYQNDKKVTIGWTGTFSSRPYLDTLRNVLIKLSLICDFKLRIIANFDYELPGIDLEVIQWSKDTEVIDLQGIDIGLYPLIPEEFVLGKSGLKAIQYMAFGIPTVATSYGTTPLLIAHMQNGLLVKTEDEWVKSLKTLIEDPSLRAKIGKNARKTIVNKYSLSAISSQYLDILGTSKEINL